ncbi:hypothetical protein [Niallia endozanthoxylica]|uniref:Uncharacterized protein n=1 Tax=Niallia endozanthoxylica TaxID=2036016 RepID=A0A5J5I5Y6_9BACI|nr:hypothetical protein [Niallia endozanthoxylica]KAA9031155.1 hypothetical protein F4V44_01620 [Niallia endozanthoxylica]
MKRLHDNQLWYVCSIVLNALGNSFMIIANLGSSPWAAAGENLSTVLPFSIGVCIILLNFFSFMLSYLMKVPFTVGIIIKSMALTLVFGIMIDVFLYFHHILFVPESIWIRCIYIFIGLNLMAAAVSIYFRTSTVYIPSDYLIKAFGRLMKNYTIGTILCTLIPISISLVIILFQQHVTGLGIGTLTYLFGIGFLIDQYNRWIVIHEVPKQNMLSI